MASQLFLEAGKLKQLQQLESWKTAAALLFDWLVIAAAIAISEYSGSWLAYLPAVLIIAGRQHAIATLIHEFSHYRFVANKSWSDKIGDLFSAWPLFVTVDGYRKNHFQHHQFANTERDPDFAAKVGTQRYTFPQRMRNLFLNLLAYLAGINAYLDLKSGLVRLNKKNKLPFGYVAARLVYYAAIACLLAYLGGIDELVLYWLLPYLSLFMAIMYVRSVSEHFAIEDMENKLEGTRTVIPAFWERAFFGPHNVCYHLEHHLYAAVPFYNLPTLHADLMRNPDYRKKAHITYGYTTGLFRECLVHGTGKGLADALA